MQHFSQALGCFLELSYVPIWNSLVQPMALVKTVVDQCKDSSYPLGFRERIWTPCFLTTIIVLNVEAP